MVWLIALPFGQASPRSTVLLTVPVGAVLAEQTDEWAEGRRYLGLDILAKSRLRLLPDTGPEEVTDSILELSA